MKIAISFLCYNNFSFPYLEYFLPSLEKSIFHSRLKNVKILAGDNSDIDFLKNKEKLKKYFSNSQLDFEIIDFQKNLGFSKAYNRLIERADKLGFDYFLMLNPDMLLKEDFLQEIIKPCLEDKNICSVSPKIYYWDFKSLSKTTKIDSLGIALRPGLRFYDMGQGSLDGQFLKNTKLLGPSGAAALFKLSALKQAKEANQYFDERFFMYKEDCDLSYRLNQNNCKSILAPKAIAYHDRSLSIKKNFWQTWRDWCKRSRLSRSWSFSAQHFLFLKHWRSQSYYSRFLIVLQIIFYFIFSLILANFLLKNYPKILAFKKRLD